jgi:hypothetical protein
MLAPAVLAAPPPFSHSVSRVTAAQLPYSWHKGCPVGPSQLRRVRLTYWGFDRKAHSGALVVNVSVAARSCASSGGLRQALSDPEDAVDRRLPGADERRSTTTTPPGSTAATSSGPGPRLVGARPGLAIDVNRSRTRTSRAGVHPKAGRAYLDRSGVRRMAVPGGLLVRAFAAQGWSWAAADLGARLPALSRTAASRRSKAGVSVSAPSTLRCVLSR